MPTLNVPSVTPVAGTAVVTTGGTPVLAAPGNVNGGFITNPVAAADQGLATAEPIYVSPVGAASLEGNGTTFRIDPGGTWEMIPGQTTPTSVNAASNGHAFSVVYY
jgi:hypothetical protein